MKTSSDGEAQIRAYLAESYGADGLATISDDESLVRAGILDSARIVALTTFLEVDLGLTIADEDLTPENLDSISSIAAFVRRARGRGGEPTR